MRCVVFELAGGGHICAPPPAVRRWLRPPAVRGLMCKSKVEGALPPHLKSWVGTCPHCPHGSYATAPIPRRGPCAAERRPRTAERRVPVPPRGGPCAAERRPLCREEALCVGRYSVLRGLEGVPVSGGGSMCRMVLLLYAERIEGYTERRPLCR